MLPQGQCGHSQTVSFLAQNRDYGPVSQPCVYQLNAFRTHTYCMTTASCGPAGTHFTVIGATERTAAAARGTRSVLKSASAEQLIGSTHGQSSIIRSRVSNQKKIVALLRARRCSEPMIQPRHSTNLARGRNWLVAHLRIAHLTNAPFSSGPVNA